MSEGATFLGQHLRPGPTPPDCDFAFIGYGLDGASTFDGQQHLPGVERAPERIRALSGIYGNETEIRFPLTTFNPSKGYLLNGLRIADLGDFPPSADPVSLAHIARVVSRLEATETVPLVVGGDHSVTLPILRGFRRRVTVLHFDAHLDFLDEPERCPHGSVMRAVSALPAVDRIIHCGIRGNLNFGPGWEETLARGNVILDADGLEDEREDLLFAHLKGDEAVYLSFDADALDPAEAPGTGLPEPGGLSYRTTRRLVEKVAEQFRIVGADFCEYNPRLDWNDLTGRCFCNLMIELMGGVNLRRMERIGRDPYEKPLLYAP